MGCSSNVVITRIVHVTYFGNTGPSQVSSWRCIWAQRHLGTHAMSFRIRLLQTRRIFARHTIRSYSSPTNTHPPTIRLRPYQEACLEACLTDLSKHDVSRIGVSLPTGAGKTTVFVSLISKMVPPLENPRATKVLIIVNSIELASQAANQVKVICPELNVEIDQGQKHKASGMADV